MNLTYRIIITEPSSISFFFKLLYTFIARKFTALARRGTKLTLQLSVEISIYTVQNYEYEICFVLEKHLSLVSDAA